MFKRVIRGASLSFALVLLSAGSAFAAPGGAGTVTNTEHFRGELFFTNESTNPCNGEPGTTTAIGKNGVFHETTHADGNFWITGTFEGTVTFTPTEAGGVFYSGHFMSWFGAALNEKNEVEHDTSTFHLTGTDGSRLTMRATDHLSTNARGEVTATFEKKTMTLSCG